MGGSGLDRKGSGQSSPSGAKLANAFRRHTLRWLQARQRLGHIDIPLERDILLSSAARWGKTFFSWTFECLLQTAALLADVVVVV